MTDLVIPTQSDNKISNAVMGFKPEEVAIIKNTVAKGTTDTELAFFLMNASMAELNPLLKEIWCYKDNKGNLIIFASRDGFVKKAQNNQYWNGFTSSYVCQKDAFEIEIGNESIRVNHKFRVTEDRGEVVGAYCIAKPKCATYPIIEYADIKTYDKKQFVWSSHKGAMIQKVAEVHCLKKAYGISGLQYEDDFEIRAGIALPVDTEPLIDIKYLEHLYSQVKGALSEQQVKDAERIIGNKEVASYNKLHSILTETLQDMQ